MKYIANYELTEGFRQEFLEKIAGFPNPYERFEDFLSRIYNIRSVLPHDLTSMIQNLRFGISDFSGIMISGLPLDEPNYKTPLDANYPPKKHLYVSEGMAVLLSNEVGFIFSYEQERQGSIIQNIIPEKGRETRNSSEGSKVDLRYHVDNGYLKFRPDFLCIVCVSNDRDGNARTLFIDNKTIISLLNEADIAILRKPLFQIKFSHSFNRRATDPEWSPNRPIIIGPTSDPEFCVKFGVTKGVTTEATRVLLNLENACETSGLVDSLTLTKGKALIVSNRRIIHARTPYQPYYDGKDRWLQRVYICLDPWMWREYFGQNRRCVNRLPIHSF